MLQSRWQLAVSDKPILVNSNQNGCYAVAAVSKPAASALPADSVYGTSLRQDGLHLGITLASAKWAGVPSMKIRTEVKFGAASRSQALMGLRKRRRKNG